jgi:transcriptional regulator with XRE-family HTH domain
MSNERLRAAVVSSGLGIDGVANRLGVDRKTIERWIAGRVPYRRHQYALAAVLSLDVAYLWPDAATASEWTALGQAELVALFPARRWRRPSAAWSPSRAPAPAASRR